MFRLLNVFVIDLLFPISKFSVFSFQFFKSLVYEFGGRSDSSERGETDRFLKWQKFVFFLTLFSASMLTDTPAAT